MLLGRDWLGEFRLDWRELHGVYSLQEGDLQRVLRKFLDVLNNELGTLKGVEATIHVQPGAQPIYHQPRPVPLALRLKVGWTAWRRTV